MFNKLDEPARRVIFFGRYEASRLGGRTISAEHLLLALLRESAWAVEPFLSPGHTVKELRREIETAAGSKEAQLPGSADMRLAEPAMLALTYAEEESARLQSETIGAPHLLLGLLRTHSKAARLLTQFGLKVDEVRLKVAQGTILPPQEPSGAWFYGIGIRFDVPAKAGSRIVADYRGHMAVIEIESAKVIQGELPDRARSMVLEWLALHKDEIIAAWNAGKAGQSAPPIPPLE